MLFFILIYWYLWKFGEIIGIIEFKLSVFNTPNPNTGTNEQVLIPEGAFLGVKLKGGFKIENRY